MATDNLEKAIQQLHLAQAAFDQWKEIPLKVRIQVVVDIKNNLLSQKDKYANAITSDMNKPIQQSIAEVEKCAYLCDYYIEHAEHFLEKQFVKTRWSESFIEFQPLGVLLGVMPWNFPFWQVFRFVIPSLLVGNIFVVKHASNVPQSAQLLEEVFNSNTLDFAVYQNMPLPSKDIASIIAHPIVKAISLTGSENAGKAVATEAGKYLKKCVLELGGSNAFIVLEDADLEKTLDKAVKARMQNAGQSCIAGKRFLIHESLYDAFVQGFIERIKNLKTGDKYDPLTELGAMAREDLAIELEQQMLQSLSEGAKLAYGGKRKGAFFEPTVLTHVTPEMTVAKQETFGPLAAMIPIRDIEEAIAISNQSDFGLGVSIFTENIDKIKSKLYLFQEGAVFVNEMVVSDPHLPFGGIKNSGYGRELSHLALYEFANIRTVVIK